MNRELGIQVLMVIAALIMLGFLIVHFRAAEPLEVHDESLVEFLGDAPAGVAVMPAEDREERRGAPVRIAEPGTTETSY